MKNHGLWEPENPDEESWTTTVPLRACKETVTTDGVVVGHLCGSFLDTEPWDIGMTAEEHYRRLDEALDQLADEKGHEDGTGGTKR